MSHPCAALAARYPLKGATLVARRSRFRSDLEWAPSAFHHIFLNR
jgi:hypothetical protein